MNSDKELLITPEDTLLNENIPSIEDLGYVPPPQQLQNFAGNHQLQTTQLQKASKVPQYFAVITATLSAVATGMVLAWTSPITTQLESGQYHNISIDTVEMGWIGSFVSLGAMLTCFPFGILCDAIGRKSALLLLLIPFGIGWSLIIWAKSVLMIYCGRFITGMAAGASCVGAPLYISEVSQKEIRGSLGGYFQLMITIGVFAAYLLGKYVTITHYTLICGAVPFLFFVLFVFQPESPLYSVKQMQIETARNSLQRLRGRHYNVELELENISVMLQNYGNNSFFNSLQTRATKRALLIIFGLMCFQQLSGVNAVIFYTSEIFNASGEKMDPQVAAIIVGAFQVIATFISSLIIEKLGRRPLLIGSDFMMALCCLCLGSFFLLKNHNLVSCDTLTILGFIPIGSLCIFIIMYSIGLGPIPWSISGEIFTPEVKSVALASSATLNWFLAFLITKFYLQLEEQFGTEVLFYVFSLLSSCGALFCYVFVPETKGKTVEEIQRDLEN